MTISIFNNKYEIAVCDEHAEDMTLKQAREHTENTLRKIESIIEEAHSYGLECGFPEKKSRRPSVAPGKRSQKPTTEERDQMQDLSGSMPDMSITSEEGVPAAADADGYKIQKKSKITKREDNGSIVLGDGSVIAIQQTNDKDMRKSSYVDETGAARMYTPRKCSLCSGSGKDRMSDGICQKCKGVGEII